MDAKDPRSECPVAGALDLIGDRWTLLVLRDLLDGKTRFSEFERSPEGIPTNILTERLRRLEAAGLAERHRATERARATYHPTRAGQDLRPVLLAMAKWGNTHLDDTWSPPADWLAPSAEHPGI